MAWLNSQSQSTWWGGVGLAGERRLPTQSRALQNRKSLLLSQPGKPKPEVQVTRLPARSWGECEDLRLTDGSKT